MLYFQTSQTFKFKPFALITNIFTDFEGGKEKEKFASNYNLIAKFHWGNLLKFSFSKLLNDSILNFNTLWNYLLKYEWFMFLAVTI